jgi:hypothetical protein
MVLRSSVMSMTDWGTEDPELETYFQSGRLTVVHSGHKIWLHQVIVCCKRDSLVKARIRNVCKTWPPFDFLRDNWNSVDYSWDSVR